MNLERLEEIATLKNSLNDFKNPMNTFKDRYETLDEFSKKIVAEELLNKYFTFYELVHFLNEKNDFDFLLKNYNLIKDFETLLLAYPIFEKIDNNSEAFIYIEKQILSKLQKEEKAIDYMIEWLFYFCNRNNLDFSFYVKNLEDKSRSFDDQVEFSFNKNEDFISVYESWREKNYFFRIEMTPEVFDIENDIHFKNGLVYLNKKGWNSSRHLDCNNRTFIAELYNFETMDILKVLKEKDIDVDLVSSIFTNLDTKIKYKHKKEIEAEFRVEYSFDLRKNNVMTLEDKLELVDTLIKKNIFFSDKFETDIIFFIENIELDEILKYKNIAEFIVKKWIEEFNYLENYHQFNIMTMDRNIHYRDIEKYWDDEDKLDNRKRIVYFINQENKVFKDYLLKRISNIENKSDKMLILPVINSFSNQSEIKKLLLKLFDIEVLFGYSKLNYRYSEAIFEKKVHPFDILSHSENILEIMFKYFAKKDFDKTISFFNTFEDFVYKNKYGEKWIANHFEDILKIKNSFDLLEYGLDNNLIELERYNELVINKIIEEDSDRNFNLIKDIDLFLSLNEKVVREFKFRWKFWKDYPQKTNIKELSDNNRIFQLLVDNPEELLTDKSVITLLVKEPFFSSEKEDTKQVEFIEKLIKYTGSVEIWNIIQRMAIVLDIKLNPLLKQEFYFTRNEELEDIFEI